LDKARLLLPVDWEYLIPPGLSGDPGILLCPASPTSPFEFPFITTEDTYCNFNVLDGLPQPCAAGKDALCTSESGCWFYMDFGFMRASSMDFSHPNKQHERVITSWDGYSSYLLVVDEASCYI
jgi:hypothetical protein